MKSTDYSTKFAKRKIHPPHTSNKNEPYNRNNVYSSPNRQDEISIEGKFSGLHLSSASCAAILSSVADTVQTIDFSHNVIDNLPNSLPPNILGVDFSYNFLRDLFVASNYWYNIIELNLSHNHITR